MVLLDSLFRVVAHPRVLEWHSSARSLKADNQVKELSNSDDIIADRITVTSEVIDLSKSDNEEDEEVAMSWYHEVSSHPQLK